MPRLQSVVIDAPFMLLKDEATISPVKRVALISEVDVSYGDVQTILATKDVRVVEIVLQLSLLNVDFLSLKHRAELLANEYQQ